MTRASLLVLALCLLPGCGDQADTTPTQDIPRILGVDKSTCEELKDAPGRSKLVVVQGDWGTTYDIIEGLIYYQGKLIVDSKLELKFCTLHINSTGGIVIEDTTPFCSANPFSSCAGSK